MGCNAILRIGVENRGSLLSRGGESVQYSEKQGEFEEVRKTKLREGGGGGGGDTLESHTKTEIV